MKRMVLATGLVLAVLAGLAVAQRRGSSGSPDRPASQPAGWDRYSLVVNRNIFLRDRKSSSSRPTLSMPSASERREGELVLMGVGVQEDGQVAFLEDTRTGQTIRAAAGQAVGTTIIYSVCLDGMEVRIGDGVRTVCIGESLSGRAASPVAGTVQETSSGPASGPAGRAGEGADKALSDIEARMRQRRQQENR